MASQQLPPPDDEYEAERERAKYRRARRKARERTGEIKELNITAMMDMMTIILVFLIKSYTASSTAVQMTEQLTLPKSTTEAQPQDNISITVAANELAVNERKIVAAMNGVIGAEFREGRDAASPLIVPLLAELEKEVDKQKYIAKYNPKSPFSGKVNIVADRRVPYHTILAVLYTAGRAELGQYKLMALKSE